MRRITEFIKIHIYIHLHTSLFVLGGSIFIHAFGAYFGIMVALTMMFRNFDHTADKQDTTPTTDVFSLLGEEADTVLHSGVTHCDRRLHPPVALLAQLQCSIGHGRCEAPVKVNTL